MNSQKNRYVQEIKYQTKMINNLHTWLKVLLFASSLSVLLIYMFNHNTPLKILGIVLLVVSVILSVLVGLGIYKGQKNVNKVIDCLESMR